MTSTWSIVLAALGSTTLIAFVVLALWPWHVEASLKAITNESAISLAGGVEVAGLSASAAAIFDGPGVVAVHLRARELWRRSIPRVSLDALLDWLDAQLAKPETKPGLVGRLVKHIDKGELPQLGMRVLLGLRDVSFHGDLTLGSSDPALAGKAAAWLYPIAGVLAPFGALDVSFDWSGRNRLDGAVEVSFRVVPARVALEGLRFAWHHVHFTMPEAIATR